MPDKQNLYLKFKMSPRTFLNFMDHGYFRKDTQEVGLIHR